MDAHALVEALLPHGLSSPSAVLEQDRILPLSKLEALADTHAHRVWGEEIGRGEPIAVTDGSGALRAYAFPYIRGSRVFPGYQRIFEEILSLTRTEERRPLFADMENRFGTVYVSATDEALPILRVDHFLHAYFRNGIHAEEIANARFQGKPAQFRRFVSIDPSHEYLEFAAGEATILLHAHTLEEAHELPVALPAAVSAPLPASDGCWKSLECASLLRMAEAAPAPTVAKYMPSLARVPALLWTLNCATTAKAMVVGYWDNWVHGTGTAIGFGRLVDYWYEHPSNSENVPNLLDEVDAAHNIDVWKVNNYSCQWDEIPANAQNDWAWKEYTAEIDADRPTCWSIEGHTMTGIGYRVGPWGKWAIVYNTWSRQPAEFVHTDCKRVARIIPKGGTTGEQAVVISPRNGEDFAGSVPAEICWYSWGPAIKKTDLSVSDDGGRSWVSIAQGVPTQQGTNFFVYVPGKATKKARARIAGYAGADYTAGDGSFGNFQVAQTLQYAGTWQKIHGAVTQVIAGFDKLKGAPVIYVTEVPSGNILALEGTPSPTAPWVKVGGPGKMFVMDGQGKLYGLSPDGAGVYLYLGQPGKWKQIGGPAKTIYGDLDGVLAVSPANGDLYRYAGTPMSWTRIGGPGKSFAVDFRGTIYGVAPDSGGLWRYSGSPMKWEQISGPASTLYAANRAVFVTKPESGNIYLYNGKPYQWTKVGGPGKSFATDTEGRLYGMSPDGSAVMRYEGNYADPVHWIQVGGPAAALYAGWRTVLATNPQTLELWAKW